VRAPARASSAPRAGAGALSAWSAPAASAACVGLCLCLALGAGGPAGAAGAGAAFIGNYADENHPGCLRAISGAGAPGVLEVTGTDGSPGCAKGEKQTPWALTGELTKQGDGILIDFSPKGGPRDLLGKKTDAGILFPDGNEWKKLP